MTDTDWEAWAAETPIPFATDADIELQRVEQAKLEDQRVLDEAYAHSFNEWRRNILSLDQMLNLPQPEPLIGGNILYTGTTAWLVGAPGTFKSFFALDWACSVATGLPWIGRDVKCGHVLYFTLEGSSGMSRRLGAWMDERDISREHLGSRLHFRRTANFLDVADRTHLLAELSLRKYALIVIDTQARATPGASENDKDQMDPFVQFITEVTQQHGTTVLIIHHSTKSGSDPSRGSGSLEGAADTMLWLKKNEEPLSVELVLYKHKDTESGESMQFELYEHMDSLILTNGAPVDSGIAGGMGARNPEAFRSLQMGALRFLRDAADIGMSKAEIVRELQPLAERLKVTAARSRLYAILVDLEGQALTTKVGGSGEARQGARIVLTAAGRARLDYDESTRNQSQYTDDIE